MRRTAAALEANGISVHRAPNRAEAKRMVRDLIPTGSQVHHGASQPLEASGIAEEIEKSGGTSLCGHGSSAWTARLSRPTRSAA